MSFKASRLHAEKLAQGIRNAIIICIVRSLWGECNGWWLVNSPLKWPLMRKRSHSMTSPWASYQIRKIEGCRECRERFPRHRLQRKPLVSDPDIHHGTCVTHVSWCMSGSLTRGGGENVPGIPGACATRSFTHLARGPRRKVSCMLSRSSLTRWLLWTFWCKVAKIFTM